MSCLPVELDGHYLWDGGELLIRSRACALQPWDFDGLFCHTQVAKRVHVLQTARRACQGWWGCAKLPCLSLDFFGQVFWAFVFHRFRAAVLAIIYHFHFWTINSLWAIIPLLPARSGSQHQPSWKHSMWASMRASPLPTCRTGCPQWRPVLSKVRFEFAECDLLSCTRPLGETCLIPHIPAEQASSNSGQCNSRTRSQMNSSLTFWSKLFAFQCVVWFL